MPAHPNCQAVRIGIDYDRLFITLKNQLHNMYTGNDEFGKSRGEVPLATM